MLIPESLVKLFQPWNDFYSHSKAAETTVQFLHIGGVLLAGGLAIAADRATLRATKLSPADRTHSLRELGAVHRVVITGLVIVVLSGLALLTADIESFFGSWIYWTKMALFVVLLINGLMMTKTESSLALDASEGSPHWASLRRAAVVSITLWFVTAALGVALVNFA